MANHLDNMMNTTMENIRQMVDVNTIIGEPVICPDGTVIIPVSKVTYGFAAGGSDLPPKTNTNKEFFGGGSGAGVSIQPVAFLVVNNGSVKMLNMEFDGAVDRVISMIPDFADKVGELFKKMSKKKDEKKENAVEVESSDAKVVSTSYREAEDIDDSTF
ncbi:MAG: GerW family sporulation protein [Acutalibacteraceae bacterium]|nr:GerW family sporulation protein [Clostridia bacterium]MEE3449528.1 GerW family sporulation protein [Acutalibacteraceae bacterium]